MRDYSSFEKLNGTILLSMKARDALKKVAIYARHNKKATNVALYGNNGYFDRASEVKDGVDLIENANSVLETAERDGQVNCILFAHGHFKDVILDKNDVCFDYRMLSSTDIARLMQSQSLVKSGVKLYTACLSCDDYGNTTMQLLSTDGQQCFQHTNLEIEGLGKLPNNSFEELIQFERINAKY